MTYESNVDIEKVMGVTGVENYLLDIPEDEIERFAKQGWTKVHVRISKPVQAGTQEQNRALHGLLQAYWLSGMHSAPESVKSFDMFRLYMKIQYGVCHDMIVDGKNISVPISWADYSKVERMEFIDSVISEIEQAGANTDKKIAEILDGMMKI